MFRYLLQYLGRSHPILIFFNFLSLTWAILIAIGKKCQQSFDLCILISHCLYLFSISPHLLSFPSSFRLKKKHFPVAVQATAGLPDRCWLLEFNLQHRPLTEAAAQENFRGRMTPRAIMTSSSPEESWNAPRSSTFCELDLSDWRHASSAEETCSPVKDCNHVQALPLCSGCAECSMVQRLYLRLNTPVSWLSFLEGRWSSNTSIRCCQHAGSFVPSAAGDTQENVQWEAGGQ